VLIEASRIGGPACNLQMRGTGDPDRRLTTGSSPWKGRGNPYRRAEVTAKVYHTCGAQVWQQNGRQHTQGIPNSSGTLPSSLEIVVCVLPKIKNL
jgi:hypothetical protein